MSEVWADCPNLGHTTSLKNNKDTRIPELPFGITRDPNLTAHL